MKAYAEKADLTGYLPVDMTLPDDPEVDRLLMRASGRIDDMVTASYDVDSTDKLPTDADVADALKEATCLQFIFMLRSGEDIEGVGGSQVSVGSFSGLLPGRYSKDAWSALDRAGLVNTP